MESFMQVFSLVKECCKEDLNEIAYKCWISPIEPYRMDDNTAILLVKESYSKQIIEKQYVGRLKEAFTKVFGFDVDVKIICENDITPELDLLRDLKETPPEDTPNLDKFLKEPENVEELKKTYEKANYEFTFDTFIVGSSNEFAYAACKAVAQKQKNKIYNPLFIYGPSGLGKTHLLMAIIHESKLKTPNINILYISSENFTNEFLTAIEKKTTGEFQNKYRHADILLIDDIQFLSGKERTQEEFFHTFNELHSLGKQIILTSDRPPKDIKTLEERLRTRFESGLLIDISPPDFETRVAIIRRKAELLNIEIPDDVTEYIALRLKDNIRQLEGAIKKIKAYKLFTGSPPSIAVAQNVIRDILNDNRPVPVTVERIVDEVAKTYNVSADDIRSKKRTAPIPAARQAAIYCIREITQMSLEAIGKEFSGRDHSTIVYSLQQMEKAIETEEHTKEIIDDIIKNIRGMDHQR